MKIVEYCLCGNELADATNSYFVIIGHYQKEQNSRGYNVFDPLSKKESSVMLDPTTPHEVDKYIKKLRNSAAADADNLKSTPKKYMASMISFPPSRIINGTLETGIFPDELKLAKVTPVCKCRDERKLSNYRPIHRLPLF